MKLRLETDRLIIRNLGPGDEDAVYAYAGDPEVANIPQGVIRQDRFQH